MLHVACSAVYLSAYVWSQISHPQILSGPSLLTVAILCTYDALVLHPCRAKSQELNGCTEKDRAPKWENAISIPDKDYAQWFSVSVQRQNSEAGAFARLPVSNDKFCHQPGPSECFDSTLA